MSKRILLSWSSGKDSAWALHVLQQQSNVEVAGLFTTVNERFDRVAMHAVRSELLRAQAQRAGLELHVINIPYPCSNERYEQAMLKFLDQAKLLDIKAMAFGDLFLPDIREYREKNLAGTGFEAMFPLWDSDTTALATEMISAGLEAVLTCIDPRKLPAELAGRRYDASLLAELPAGIDPCGENGEFHTFVSAGPMFSQAIEVSVSPGEEHDGFVFADVKPTHASKTVS